MKDFNTDYNTAAQWAEDDRRRTRTIYLGGSTKTSSLQKAVAEDMERVSFPVTTHMIRTEVESTVVTLEHFVNKVKLWEKKKPMSDLFSDYFKTDHSIREAALFGRQNSNGIRNMQKALNKKDPRPAKAVYLFILALFFQLTPLEALKIAHKCNDREVTELWMYRPEGAVLCRMLEKKDYDYAGFVWRCCQYRFCCDMPLDLSLSGDPYWKEVYRYVQAGEESLEMLGGLERRNREKVLFPEEYERRRDYELFLREIIQYKAEDLMDDHLKAYNLPYARYYGYLSDYRIDYTNYNPAGYIARDDTVYCALRNLREDLSASDAMRILAECKAYYGVQEISADMISEYIVPYYLPEYKPIKMTSKYGYLKKLIRKRSLKGKFLLLDNDFACIYDSDTKKIISNKPLSENYWFTAIWGKAEEIKTAPKPPVSKESKSKNGSKDHDHFCYDNPNPRKKRTMQDSLYRALSVFFDMSWEEVALDLGDFYIVTGRTMNYIQSNPWRNRKFSERDFAYYMAWNNVVRLKGFKGMELKDLANEYGEMLVRYGNDNFTVVKDGGVFHDVKDLSKSTALVKAVYVKGPIYIPEEQFRYVPPEELQYGPSGIEKKFNPYDFLESDIPPEDWCI